MMLTVSKEDSLKEVARLKKARKSLVNGRLFFAFGKRFASAAKHDRAVTAL
jgi:hypothetical protein